MSIGWGLSCLAVQRRYGCVVRSILLSTPVLENLRIVENITFPHPQDGGDKSLFCLILKFSFVRPWFPTPLHRDTLKFNVNLLEKKTLTFKFWNVKLTSRHATKTKQIANNFISILTAATEASYDLILKVKFILSTYFTEDGMKYRILLTSSRILGTFRLFFLW